jgi:ABC-type dipeptide/oligopeptide/nickel transport system permease component
MQALLARKKIEQQEKELRELIVYKWGTDAYVDMLRDRARIKDTRAKAIQNQRRKIKKLIANVLTITAILGLVGAIVAFGIGILMNLG